MAGERWLPVLAVCLGSLGACQGLLGSVWPKGGTEVLLGQQGRFPWGSGVSFEAISSAPEPERRKFMAGWLLGAVGWAAGARPSLAEGLSEDATALLKNARQEEVKGNIDKAFKLYSKVVELEPTYPYAWSNRGNMHILRGDLRAALDDYTRAVDQLPSAGSAGTSGEAWLIYLNRATTRLALNEDAKLALDDLNAAALMRRAPDAALLTSRAQAYERLEDWASAAADYQAALSLRPNDIQPWWVRFALVLFQLGRDVDAATLARRVRSKFSGEAEAGIALTCMLVEERQLGEASKLWFDQPLIQRQRYSDPGFLRNTVKWPPRAVSVATGLDKLFQSL